MKYNATEAALLDAVGEWCRFHFGTLPPHMAGNDILDRLARGGLFVGVIADPPPDYVPAPEYVHKAEGGSGLGDDLAACRGNVGSRSVGVVHLRPDWQDVTCPYCHRWRIMYGRFDLLHTGDTSDGR